MSLRRPRSPAALLTTLVGIGLAGIRAWFLAAAGLLLNAAAWLVGGSVRHGAISVIRNTRSTRKQPSMFR